MIKTSFTPDQAWPKIKQFCGYRERCHFEVKEKLFSMGLPKKEVEILICRLIDENYLNEERFAILFAGGHFRQKKWGKVKIAYELSQKRVPPAIIKRAIKEVEGPDYTVSLQKLAEVKWKSLRGVHHLTRQAKTTSYLLQKGYERTRIQQVLTDMITGNKNL